MKIEIFFKIKVNKPSKFREIKEALQKRQLVPRTDWQDHIFSISHEIRGNLNIFSGICIFFRNFISNCLPFLGEIVLVESVVTWQVLNQSNLLPTKCGEISSKLRTKSFRLGSDLSKTLSRDYFLTNQKASTDLTSWLLSQSAGVMYTTKKQSVWEWKEFYHNILTKKSVIAKKNTFIQSNVNSVNAHNKDFSDFGISFAKKL